MSSSFFRMSGTGSGKLRKICKFVLKVLSLPVILRLLRTKKNELRTKAN